MSARRSGGGRGRPTSRPGEEDALVWSSAQGGRVRPAAGSGAAAEAPSPGDGVARVRREKSGRRGKTVTTVRGVPLPADDLRRLAADLKRRCGSGGAVKQGVIEIQGDHREEVIAALEARGLRAKRAGG